MYCPMCHLVTRASLLLAMIFLYARVYTASSPDFHSSRAAFHTPEVTPTQEQRHTISRAITDPPRDTPTLTHLAPSLSYEYKETKWTHSSNILSRSLNRGGKSSISFLSSVIPPERKPVSSSSQSINISLVRIQNSSQHGNSSLPLEESSSFSPSNSYHAYHLTTTRSLKDSEQSWSLDIASLQFTTVHMKFTSTRQVVIRPADSSVVPSDTKPSMLIKSDQVQPHYSLHSSLALRSFGEDQVGTDSLAHGTIFISKSSLQKYSVAKDDKSLSTFNAADNSLTRLKTSYASSAIPTLMKLNQVQSLYSPNTSSELRSSSKDQVETSSSAHGTISTSTLSSQNSSIATDDKGLSTIYATDEPSTRLKTTYASSAVSIPALIKSNQVQSLYSLKTSLELRSSLKDKVDTNSLVHCTTFIGTLSSQNSSIATDDKGLSTIYATDNPSTRLKTTYSSSAIPVDSAMLNSMLRETDRSIFVKVSETADGRIHTLEETMSYFPTTVVATAASSLISDFSLKQLPYSSSHNRVKSAVIMPSVSSAIRSVATSGANSLHSKVSKPTSFKLPSAEINKSTVKTSQILAAMTVDGTLSSNGSFTSLTLNTQNKDVHLSSSVIQINRSYHSGGIKTIRTSWTRGTINVISYNLSTINCFSTVKVTQPRAFTSRSEMIESVALNVTRNTKSSRSAGISSAISHSGAGKGKGNEKDKQCCISI